MKQKHKALCKDHTEQKSEEKGCFYRPHYLNTNFHQAKLPKGLPGWPTRGSDRVQGRKRGADSGTFTGSAAPRCACAPCIEQAGRLENRGAPDSRPYTLLPRIERGDPPPLTWNPRRTPLSESSAGCRRSEPRGDSPPPPSSRRRRSAQLRAPHRPHFRHGDAKREAADAMFLLGNGS